MTTPEQRPKDLPCSWCGEVKRVHFQVIETGEAVAQWLLSIADCDLEEIAADGGVTVGMVVQKEARDQARRLSAVIANSLGDEA